MKKLSVPMTKLEITLGWVFLVLQLTALPFLLQLVNLLLGFPLSEAEINFVFFFLNFVCILTIFWRFLIENGRIAITNPLRCLQSAFFAFAVYWLLNILFSLAVQLLYPEFYNVNDDSIQGLVQENSQLMILGTVFLVPVTEEVLYRGLIFRGLYNRSPLAAYLVSTVVFSALHVVGYIHLYKPLHLLLCFVQYFPASVCLGWAYARANSIWVPILIHVTINQIAMLAMR